MAITKRNYDLGQYVAWKHPKSGDSGDGIIKEAMFREDLGDKFDKGWYYLIFGAWVFQGCILENRN